ncbi:ribulose-phosphate 3-epimerase [Aureococcus anophagefferens]|nr:ribulose-phosphate 3-epimerase [Aureococcus anophagefferens]
MGYKLPPILLYLLAIAPATRALPSFFKRESKPRLAVAVDVGTESLRVAVFDEDGVVVGSATEAHETFYPAPGRAEQVPDAWWHNLGVACKRAVGDRAADVASLCLATTSCTVVACDAAGAPLRDCLLWMDARSATEAEDILEMGAGEPALRVNSGGAGPISAEWMLPKALWLKRHEPETWDNAAVVCECQDWLNFKLTGGWAAGGSNVAAVALRRRCGRRGAAASRGPFRPFGGRPSALLAKIGLADLEDKWPMRCVATGAAVGTLTKAAAAHLGLPRSVVVAQGGADAFVGIVGAGCATARGGVVVAHAWRAALEAVCLGTRNSLEGLSRALKDDGDDDDAPLHVCGGATKSEIFLQMHADAAAARGRRRREPAPLLGAAVLAFAALDRAARPKLDVERAVESRVKRMVRPKTRLEPRPYQSAAFDRLDRRVRSRLAPAVAPISRACADLAAAEVPADDRPRPPRKDLPGGLRPVVAPSLLAADPANLADAARAALSAGATWLHVDVFDGSKACGGALSNMGPGTVSALRAALGPDASARSGSARASASHRPRPRRPTRSSTGLVDLVDVLFVEPGRGGQDFNEDCLERGTSARAPGVDLMADGGIHETAAPRRRGAASRRGHVASATAAATSRRPSTRHAALAEGAGHAHVDQQRNIA